MEPMEKFEDRVPCQFEPKFMIKRISAAMKTAISTIRYNKVTAFFANSYIFQSMIFCIEKLLQPFAHSTIPVSVYFHGYSSHWNYCS